MKSGEIDMHSPPSPRYLVIQLARFGDLIQTSRLVRSLQESGETHLLVDSSLTALARLVYPGVLVHGIAAHGTHGPDILARVCADLGDIAGLDFHRVYNLNFSGPSFALAGMFDPSTVRGYRSQRGQRLIDSWPGQIMRWTGDRCLAGLNLVDVWGLYAEQPVAPERVNSSGPGAALRGGGLGVVMAGQNARRSLPAQVLAPLVVAARGRVGHGPIHLLGSAGERRAARELAALLPATLRGEVRDLVGRTGWSELYDVVGGLDLLVSPDTGTMHLAAHLGVPVLAFFLSSAWCHETGPYGRGHLVLQATMDCAPCLETAPCPHDIDCRRVFSDPSVLRHVSGHTGRALAPGCLVMESGFDELGLTFTAAAGTDPMAARRRAFRIMAAAYAGVPMPGGAGCLPEETWMRERDWMLPQTLRGRAHD
jgi:ADP-heptose:LPS heptosyltransferase